MAEVPYGGGVPQATPDTRVPADVYQRIDARPEQFGGAIARGVEKLGAGAGEASTNVFNAAAFYGKTVADDASNQRQKAGVDILHGDPTRPATDADGKPILGPDGKPLPDTGFLGRTGADAMRAWPAAKKQLDDLDKQFRSNLTTPEQQLEYDNFTRRLRAIEDSQIGTHADTQTKTWMQTKNKDGADLQLQIIATNVGDTPLETEQRTHAFSDLLRFRTQAAQVASRNDPTAISDAMATARRDGVKAWALAVSATDAAKADRIIEKNKADLGTEYQVLKDHVRVRFITQTGHAVGIQALAQARNAAPAPVADNLPAATAAFFRERSSARVQGLNSAFADRLMQATSDFEASNPGRIGRFESLRRTTEEQSDLYRRYRIGQGGLAAPPGQSMHEFGLAADVPDGAFLNWLHQNAGHYGLEFLKGRSFDNDPGHVQFAGASPQIGVAPSATGRGAASVTAWSPASPAKPSFGTVSLPPSGAIKADAYQFVRDNPNLSDEVKEAAFVTIDRDIRHQEIIDNQSERARQDGINEALGEYTTLYWDMDHSPQKDFGALADRINHDPRLATAGPAKEALMERIVKRSGKEQTMTYGEKFSEVKAAILSEPGTPGHISNMAEIYELPPDYLTAAGENKVKEIFNDIKKGPDALAVERARSGIERYAHGILSFHGEFSFPNLPPKRDENGEEFYNGTFIPAFEAAFSRWVTGENGKVGKSPWEFLDKKNIDKFIDGLPGKRTKAQMEADRLWATGEAAGEKGAPPQEPLPPTPADINAAGWVPLVKKPPLDKNGRPWPMAEWANSLRYLHDNPTPEVKAAFNRSFANLKIDADQVLAKFVMAPETAVPPRPAAAAPAATISPQATASKSNTALLPPSAQPSSQEFAERREQAIIAARQRMQEAAVERAATERQYNAGVAARGQQRAANLTKAKHESNENLRRSQLGALDSEERTLNASIATAQTPMTAMVAKRRLEEIASEREKLLKQK